MLLRNPISDSGATSVYALHLFAMSENDILIKANLNILLLIA